MELHRVSRQKIVALFGMGTTVTYPAIAQVDAYWEALRGERTMPERSEVDPRGLELALTNAFILEQVAPGVGRLRVAGMHLNDLMGMEVRGMPLSALFEPAARARLSETLKAVVADPQVAEIDLAAPRGIGRPALSGRVYLAPLANTGRGAPRVLGCLETSGLIGKAPRRFEIDRIRSRALAALAGTPENAVPDRADAPAPTGLEEPGAAFRHRASGDAAPHQTRARPHLRLVKND